MWEVQVKAVQVCGKDAGGCRLAFDLGKSDIKTVAVKAHRLNLHLQGNPSPADP